jgi:hypothetical protein
VRILNQPTNAELATIPEHERKRFFRVSMVKANYSLTTRDTRYQLATVQIPNKQMTETRDDVRAWSRSQLLPTLPSPEAA